ncbi:MAG: P-II family nitrogen regulator [bacterium]
MTDDHDEPWMVQAVIQPFKLDTVTRSLEALAGFAGMTVTAVRGFGREKLEDRAAAHRAPARGGPAHEPLDDFTAKLRLDIAVTGRVRADEVAAVIARAAHTGNRGDGKIFLWPLARVIRVRTMEEGHRAL